MKRKAWIWIVVVAAVAIIICALKLRQPEPSLLDKAMELENGQLLCADGTLWQRDEDAQELDVIVKCGMLSGKIPEQYVQGEIPIDMLPYEFAAYIAEESSAFLDNTGKVWRLKSESGERCVIEPFYLEEELPKTETDGVKAYRRGIERLWVEVEDPDTELNPFFVVAVRLSNGWHNLSKGSMGITMYAGNRREYEASYETPKRNDVPTYVEGEYRVEVYVPRDGEYYYGHTIWIEHNREF